MKKGFHKWKHTFGMTRYISRMEPMYPYLALPQAILKAVIPVILVYFSKAVLDRLTNGAAYQEIVRLILAYGCVLLAIHLLVDLFKNRTDLILEMFPKRFQGEMGKTIMGLPFMYTERATARTLIHLSANASQIIQVQTLVQNILTEAITAFSLAIIIVQFDIFFLVLVAMILCIRIWFTTRNHRYFRSRRKRLAENDRIDSYLHKARNSEGGAKELRVNSLQEWFTEKVKRSRTEMLDIQFGFFNRMARYNMVMAMIMALQTLCILWILVKRYTDGFISIGDFSLYYQSVIALTASLSSIAEHIGKYSEMQVYMADYQELLTLHSEDASSEEVSLTESHFIAPDRFEIEFRQVSFRYPCTEQDVLRNINLTIHHGEKLVLVGFNGAGKTTFVKLLCKLYRPSSGVITLNGIDIWNIPNGMYYKMVAAVFQDFGDFAFTLKENITLAEGINEVRMERSISDAGLSSFVERLPQGYETYLSRRFDEKGFEFSGGERQKVAIARALYKDAAILILDEPTASLDPKAEEEIYTSFFRIAEHKTTIFVSHRLAASTIADHIAVFQKGEIIEYGSHTDLIEGKGVYAEMYDKQSQLYRTSV